MNADERAGKNRRVAGSIDGRHLVSEESRRRPNATKRAEVNRIRPTLNPRYSPNSCADSELPVVLKFNPDGILVRSFGGGSFAIPHGFHVDRDGNVWGTDAPFVQGVGAARRLLPA